MITQITCGPSEFSIVGIPSSEYPELPSVEGASSIDLTSPILKSMIRQTLFAVADTDAKPVHTGTLFNIENGIYPPGVCGRLPAGHADGNDQPEV